MRQRMEPEERKNVILSAAIELANDKGLSEVTFKTVAAKCIVQTEPRTVASYFKIGELRRAILLDHRTNGEVHGDAVAMGIQITQ